MPERINCETFQIRTNVHRLTTRAGIGVTAVGNRRFIDPQLELNTNISAGPAAFERLWLALAQGWKPSESVVTELSIHPGLFKAASPRERSRFRVHPPVKPGEAVGRAALVSVVDHSDHQIQLVAGKLKSGEQSRQLQNYLLSATYFGRTTYGPNVGLVLLAPGATVSVDHEIGSYFSDLERHTYRYQPGEGLVHVDEMASQTPPPTPPPPGELGGVREPRRPLPTAPSVMAERE